jgi:hypothetical protein
MSWGLVVVLVVIAVVGALIWFFDSVATWVLSIFKGIKK